VKILFIGDIYGKPGRRVAASLVPQIREKEGIDFVIANGENVAGGFGLTPQTFQKLNRYKIDCITTGNHFWNRKEIIRELSNFPNLLRPANYPESTPGRGSQVFYNKIGVINLAGREFMPTLDCPFRVALREIKKLNTNIIIVDFHAESIPEKQALGVWLNGKVSGVIGTHSHTQTTDAQILSRGTAYITDVGMTGSFSSVIGVIPRKSISHFIEGIPHRFDSASGEEYLNAVILDIEEKLGKALSIKCLKIPANI
jgi:hypothetical protein